MFQSPLSRGTPPDDMDSYQSEEKDYQFQSPLSRGTPPDLRRAKHEYHVELVSFNPL